MLKVGCLWFLSSTDSTIISITLWCTVACDPAHMFPLRQRTAQGTQRHSSTDIGRLFKSPIEVPLDDAIPREELAVIVIDALDECAGLSTLRPCKCPVTPCRLFRSACWPCQRHWNAHSAGHKLAGNDVSTSSQLVISSDPGLHFIFVPCIAGKSYHCLFIQMRFLFTLPMAFTETLMTWIWMNSLCHWHLYGKWWWSAIYSCSMIR